MQTELFGGSGEKMWHRMGEETIPLPSALLPVPLALRGLVLRWLPKSLGKASSVGLGEASDVGEWELEQEVMEHHVVPTTTIWVVGTSEAPLWGFPEIACLRGR